MRCPSILLNHETLGWNVLGPLTLRVHDLGHTARPRRSTSISPMKDAPARARPFARAWSEGEPSRLRESASCCEFREGKGSAYLTAGSFPEPSGRGVHLLPGRDYTGCCPALRRSTPLDTRDSLLAFGSRCLELITLLPADEM